MISKALRQLSRQFSKQLFVATIIALVGGQLVSGVAFAYPKASSLTCDQMRKMIDAKGKVYIFTRFGSTRLFVNNSAYCLANNMRLNYITVVAKGQKYCQLRGCSDADWDDINE